MQVLKTHDIDLLRQNGAVFREIRLVPLPENPQIFSVEFIIDNGESMEKGLLMNTRNKIRTFGNIRKAVLTLYEIFPEMSKMDFLQYKL